MSEASSGNEPKIEPPKMEKPSGKTLMIVMAVVVVVILAVIGVWLLSDGTPSEDELTIEVDPESAEIRAGETVELTAIAMFNDDPLTDWDNLSLEWTVSDDSVGQISETQDPDVVIFEAGSEPGECTITCNATYLNDDSEFNASTEVEITVLPAALARIDVEPATVTIIHDEVVILNATAVDTLGQNISGLQINWTVEGIPSANYTINSTSGSSVNFTANATATVWVNASASFEGVTKTGTIVVTVIGNPPTMDISLTLRQQKLVIWTCTEPSSELAWDDVIIALSDGTVTVSWSINSTDLDNGTTSIAWYGPRLLDGDEIWLNITDALGNGVVNATDTISFTTDGRFNPIKTYLVTVVFEPSMDEMASRNFQGV